MSAFKITGAIVLLSAYLGASQQVAGPLSVSLTRDLVGMEVESPQGEDLGKVEDIVVHPGGSTSYAVLSFGGWMGIGDKLFAMPWNVLKHVERDPAERDSEAKLVLPLTKERLKSAPGFDKAHWPAMANADWASDIDSFYAGAGNPNMRKPVEAAARTSIITWKLSDLRGTNVSTPDGDKLGEIKGLAIDSNGRVNYAVLSVGGFLGIGDRLVAVPWDVLKFSLSGDDGDKKSVSLATTKEQLSKAPEFKDGKDDRGAMCDPAWITRVHGHFASPPYWKTEATPVGTGSSR